MRKCKFEWIFLLGIIPVLLGCKSVHTELFIPAESEVIWSILMDETSYKEWHPVLVPLEGEKLKEGETLKYTMISPNGKNSEVEAKVVEMIENKKLNQYGGIWGIMTFDHTYLLEPVDGGTRLIQHEEYRGVYVPFWDPGWVETGYQKANAALRDKVIKMNKVNNN